MCVLTCWWLRFCSQLICGCVFIHNWFVVAFSAGLMGGWYDACTGWAASIGRIQFFDFSLPFLQNFDSYFFKKKGGAFDPTDIRGKSIGNQLWYRISYIFTIIIDEKLYEMYFKKLKVRSLIKPTNPVSIKLLICNYSWVIFNILSSTRRLCSQTRYSKDIWFLHQSTGRLLPTGTPRGGGHSGTEGGRTFVTYFAEEGVFFKTSACPRFCKRRVLFCTQYEVWGSKSPYNPRNIRGSDAEWLPNWACDHLKYPVCPHSKGRNQISLLCTSIVGGATRKIWKSLRNSAVGEQFWEYISRTSWKLTDCGFY